MVAVILDNLADGMAQEKMVAQYPPAHAWRCQSAISYAAALAREEELIPPR